VPPGPGGQHCTDNDAAVAWARARGLATNREVVAQSHLRVCLRRCRACGQGYAWIFCETMDSPAGDDPQEWLLFPVSAAEARQIAVAGEPGIVSVVDDLPPRRYVRRQFGRPTMPAGPLGHRPGGVPAVRLSRGLQDVAAQLRKDL
jgi:hypothetical protein